MGCDQQVAAHTNTSSASLFSSLQTRRASIGHEAQNSVPSMTNKCFHPLRTRIFYMKLLISYRILLLPYTWYLAKQHAPLPRDEFPSPFWNRSPVLETIYLKLLLICPQNEPAILKGFCTDFSRQWGRCPPPKTAKSCVYYGKKLDETLSK